MHDSELVAQIVELKHKLGIQIYAHYYMSEWLQKSESLGGIADFTGDSLALSMEAAKSNAETILFCGVRFMAETVKILKPSIRVYMPDSSAGCSLAESIDASQLHQFRQKYPDIPIVGYINTYAETKTMLDICCTSRNAIKIIESLDASEILFVPDKHMGANLNRQLEQRGKQKLLLWDGACEVHEGFTKKLLDQPNAEIPLLIHWEVPAEASAALTAERTGIIGSTGDILDFVNKSEANTFYLASECDLATTIKTAHPEVNIITPCIECHYMKQNDLGKVLNLLLKLNSGESADDHEITLDADTIAQAVIPIKKMLELS